jgi:hypothetical protein
MGALKLKQVPRLELLQRMPCACCSFRDRLLPLHSSNEAGKSARNP